MCAPVYAIPSIHLNWFACYIYRDDPFERQKALLRNEIRLNDRTSLDHEDGKYNALPVKADYANQNTRMQMKRKIGFIEAISLIIGVMIGSGIFSSPRSVAKNSGSLGMSLLVWTGSGVISLFGALCYIELGTMIRESGGEKQYLAKGFGDWAGFLFTWTSVLVLKPSSISAIAFACGEYIAEAFYPGCRGSTETIGLVKFIAAFVIGMSRVFNVLACLCVYFKPFKPILIICVHHS